MSEILMITTRRTLVPVPLTDIRYFEKSLRLIFLHTVNDRYRYYGDFRQLTGRLDQRFCRCHYSFIVNLERVVKLEDHQFIMDCGSRVLISQRRYAAARAAFIAYYTTERISCQK